jgi:uncharacterized protein (TIGR03435 family)
VASIRPSNTDRQGGPYFMPGGRFRATGVTMKLLMRIAYSYGRGGPLLDSEIVGGPSWLGTDRFDLEAALDNPVPSDPAALLRLQRLLEERFALRVRTETREMPIYALVEIEQGFPGRQLRLSTAGCPPPGTAPLPPGGSCGVDSAAGRMIARGVQLSYLAFVLSGTPAVDRRVVDRTGRLEFFDFDLSWAPMPVPDRPADAAPDIAGPSIFTALREQLGVALEPARAPQEILVIEDVERAIPN